MVAKFRQSRIVKIMIVSTRGFLGISHYLIDLGLLASAMFSDFG